MTDVELKKIGDVAKLLGTTPRTLRFYEEEGLVTAHRTPKGTRLYSDGDIARFRAILHLTNSGISINFISQLAMARDAYDTGADSSQQVQTILDELMLQVEAQMEALQELKSELTFAGKAVNGCTHCNNPPTRKGCPSCPVHENLAVSDMLNLIWEQETRSHHI
ncbi:MerR family transcriptional regulator [Candidatus Albibeggiatoa sp. nov. NOAA]|uniref:helix-turn-helix domain-containing protein n=1 Tax=Candidatus Albibeggiatoa sp. nov. NOAA TaxID=3162724 RepID=UPI0032F2DA33|nr:MerR family transcriptional regulator [Thiotrichaceae bacterium]